MSPPPGSDPAPSGDPWHLPGLRREVGEGPWHEGTTGSGAKFRAPRLAASEAVAVAEGVRAAGLEARRQRALDQVIESVGRAAQSLADPETRSGTAARAILTRELGWPSELAGETLSGMAAGWEPATLRSLVRREVGDPAVLDRFVSAPDVEGLERSRRAAGPPLLFQVQAGNVPGVGITGVIRGLLARSGVLVKSAREEPGLVAEFARSLERVDPLLGRAVAATWWPGDTSPPPAREWPKRSGKAVIYGGREAVRGMRAGLPVECELVVYGPKTGVGLVLPDADRPEAARALARDVCAYEQRGCVSPRLVFTLPEDARRPFSRMLREALSDEVKRTGRSRLTPAEASAIRNLRAEVELGGWGEAARVVGESDEVEATVITSPSPRLEGRALTRVVEVYGCGSVAGWGEMLRPLEGHIQAVGYAGREGREELAREAALLGACRVAPFGTVAWPPADWRHDGRHQLLPLLRWTELEAHP